MIRTTAEQVANLAQFADQSLLEPYIETASSFVDELEEKGANLTESRFELVERHLAAHLATLAGVVGPSSVASKSIAGASTSYTRPTGRQGLEATPFGLTAKQLDSSRKLSGILDGEARITYLGTEP